MNFSLGINKATSAPFRNFGNDRKPAGFPQGLRQRDEFCRAKWPMSFARPDQQTFWAEASTPPQAFLPSGGGVRGGGPGG